jgi:hypothetical protein
LTETAADRKQKRAGDLRLTESEGGRAGAPGLTVGLLMKFVTRSVEYRTRKKLDAVMISSVDSEKASAAANS